jgi:predicted MFS family arabinose efflux permease
VPSGTSVQPQSYGAPVPRHETRSVAAILGAIACSAGSAALVFTVLGKLVFDITGSELALGLLGLAEFAPAALLVFVTGPLADRHDRRRIAATASTVEALTVAGLALYAAGSPTAVWPIFVSVVVIGTARAFGAPASRSLPADTVAPERLPWLVARRSIAYQSAMILGPVLGGFLYVVGVGLPFLLGAILTLTAAGLVLLVEPRQRAAPRGPRPSLSEAMEGLRFVRSEPILFGAISLDLVAVLFGGAVALLPAIAEDRLGVGAAVVTLVLAVRPLRRHVGPVLLVAVGVFGLSTIVLGATTSFAVAFVALLVLAGADSVSVFIRSTIVPLATPHEMRGRVLAVEMVFIGASNELGAFESGVTGQFLGPGPAVVLGGVATLAVSVLWWRAFPVLARLDGFPEPRTPLDADEADAGEMTAGEMAADIPTELRPSDLDP